MKKKCLKSLQEKLRMLQWKRSSPLSTHSGKCFCKAIVHKYPGELYMKEQGSMTPAGEVTLQRSIAISVPLFLTVLAECCSILTTHPGFVDE